MAQSRIAHITIFVLFIAFHVEAHRKDLAALRKSEFKQAFSTLAEDTEAYEPTNDYKFGTLLENCYIRLHRYLFKKGRLPVDTWGREWDKDSAYLARGDWTRAPALSRESVYRFWEAEKHNIPPHAVCLEQAPAMYTRKHKHCETTWTMDYESNINKARVDASSHTIHTDLSNYTATELYGAFDSIVATQVLQFPSKPHRAMHTWFDLLKPGGVLLTTQPFIERDTTLTDWPDHYRFSCLGMESLLIDAGFQVETVYYGGNALLTTGFLMGFSVHDFTEQELKATLIKKGSPLHDGIYYATLIVARKPHTTPRRSNKLQV